jgi:hypothetical protein
MGAEYLRTGEMRVRRTWDRQTLIDIKKGTWPLQSVKNYADELFKDMPRALSESCLPERIHPGVVEDIVMPWLRKGVGQ